MGFTPYWRRTMSTSFDDFIKELEAEARAEGPDAVAELEAFRLHFSLARQLAEHRRAQRLTQKELAMRSGIDQAEISRIERGQANPTTSTLAAVTSALDVDVQLVPAGDRPALGDDAADLTQPITKVDLRYGRVRLPITTSVKDKLPDAREEVRVLLRGDELAAAYDPRLGPDRERSGVLRVPKHELDRRVEVGERLRIGRRSDGLVTLD